MRQIVRSIEGYGKALLRKICQYVSADPHCETRWTRGRALRVERRREERHEKLRPCTYGLMRQVDRDGVMLEEGHGTAVDESPNGLRLLLGIAPSKGQLVEVQTAHSSFKGAVYLAEVCWTKSLREESEEGRLYLVGCRVNFGSTHFEA